MVNVEELRRDGKGKLEGYFVDVNREEAIRIIKSLSTQLLTKNPNAGREEFTETHGYFSIAIHEE